MSFSAIFVMRPIGTILITIGIVLAGALAFLDLPVAPLPQVDFPTIVVSAQLPGAGPEIMATSIAAPLERRLGQIAHVTEMTSASSLGQTRIVLQFDIDRDIDGAARDVQAAIDAARADLPATLHMRPSYRKTNPADAPLVILTLASKTLAPSRLYELASDILQQRLSRLEGVGQVLVGGSSAPAVRVELDPKALAQYGVGLEDIRAALASANANSPKGEIVDSERRFQIYANDRATRASDYRSLVVAYRNGAPLRLEEIAEVVDSVEDVRNEALMNGERSVAVYVFRQPGSNVIETVDRIKNEMPLLEAALPSTIDLALKSDRSNTIRASLRETETALVVAVLLVTLIVFAFLRDLRATLIPTVAITASIIGTFGAIWLAGMSLNNFSLMALIVAAGFVVDDAIVVQENIQRHIEAGMGCVEAAVRGAREVAFTVTAISVSLIAVFTPILLMGGLLGRLFREFAVTLSLAVLVSLVLSLTTTPMLCAVLSKRRSAHSAPRFDVVAPLLRGYGRTLDWALRHGRLVLAILLATIGANYWLFSIIPKGFFPQQDTGRLAGMIVADESASFESMRRKLAQFEAIIQSDPAVAGVAGGVGSGSGRPNTGQVFVDLKPRDRRDASADEVIGRLRGKLAKVAGAQLFLQSVQEFRVGGRASNAQYQFTLYGENTDELHRFAPRLVAALRQSTALTDVNSDAQRKGQETRVVIDRDRASQLGVTMKQVDDVLYDAFGQRQASVIYGPITQSHVVMEVAPRYWQDPDILNDLYVAASGGAPSGTAVSNAAPGTVSKLSSGHSMRDAERAASESARNMATNALATTSRGPASAGAAVATRRETMAALAAFGHFGSGGASTVVNHQGLFAAVTISFNLRPGATLGEASDEIRRITAELHMPGTIHGALAGTARAFEDSLAKEGWLVAGAFVIVYIVLGILYESLVHPVTILSTLPSAGVGAVLALMLFGMDFSVVALIGVILLIGIVKKNAIMMIDFALEAQRAQRLAPREAIFRAGMMRFRPIMMTTMAAIFGAIPLALTFGDGGELRRPLGVAIVGGLIFSQLLTLYTTPVVYLYLEEFRRWSKRRWRSRIR
ncbi:MULTISPECIES: efflux RND transporter permease subunit [Methylosinus]|uniref:Nodulation protein n=1 Tax=Methylosinus trichosporium (strain ATCC 35070 / NCIMB 11131 / UNIQEM 75 / OB3b) TaxID=595536 RepID=A0A2D2D1D9_METT3|nr:MULTISPECIES: efflux RND transporter permease subunit [Methylosinus]ATQ68807.1 nodulation protein [Methylosinus trichosporium OB3b]OBS51491.1 nodulation protein [Methylosinus sp. 3S-1]